MKVQVPDIQDSLKVKLREAVTQVESIGKGVDEKWMKIKTVLNYICKNTLAIQTKRIRYGNQTKHGILLTRGK
jgi:adenine-specific DNA methylase